jgi:hypothetical protein
MKMGTFIVTPPSPIIADSYAPAEAERGKYVVLDMSTITDYPSSGRGKYAMLTYNVSPVTLSISGGLNIGGITSPVTVTNVASAALYTTQTLPTSNYIWSGTYNTSATVINSIIPVAKTFEVYNKSVNTAYLLFSNTTDINVLTAVGLPINSGSFYSIQREVNVFSIGCDGDTSDLRIFGHY